MAPKKRATSKKASKKAALKPRAKASQSVALKGAVAIGVAGSLASPPQEPAVGSTAIGVAGGSGPTAGTAPQFSNWALPPQNSVTAFGRGAFTGAFETPPPLPLISPIITIERVIAQRPSEVREKARYFAKEFSLELDKLRRTKPNEPEKLMEYERVVDLINLASDGFKELADTLDEAALNKVGSNPEPVLLGRAAGIVHSLGEATKKWFAENNSLIFEGAVRIGLLGLGILFLTSLGIDPTITMTAAVAYIAKNAGKSKPHNDKKPSKKR
jgi:hypothetical protein